MKLEPKNVKKFQEGGQMTAPTENPEAGTAPEGQQDPMMQLAQMAVQALQSQDCNLAMQVCDTFVQMLQQAQGAPAPEDQGEPVFRAGGKLNRRIKE